jgi:energy-coupling factor transporter transmembrane protein EcfT
MGNIIYRYLIVVIACISLLIGLQVPNFADQYEKRVDAHLREASIDLQPFLDIADKFFKGNTDKLIEMHYITEEQSLRDEGEAIENMIQRKKRFEADMNALKTNLPMRALNILLHGDHEIIDEVRAQYSYAAPINEEALIFSSCVSLSILLMVELLIMLTSIALVEISRSLRRISSPSKRYM